MFSSRLHTAADADAPTPPDSDGDMNLCPDIEPECDQDPSTGPEIEEQREELEHQPLSGRQKASAQLEPIHPPTVIAKLCSSAFKKSTRRILENVRGNYAVPPGTQPEAMVSCWDPGVCLQGPQPSSHSGWPLLATLFDSDRAPT